MPASSAPANIASGRYMIFGEIASGGMATIRYGRLVGALGFSRPVAIKQLHPQFAKDENFVSMILDEARLSARISHANVVQTIDVLSEPGELSIVMEYVRGESLGRLLELCKQSRSVVPVRIAVTLVAGILHGLQAAHETRGEQGEPLHIVHRDVSPENILVASDGIARLIDFGVARAQGRSRITPAGELKGKLAYMAVEQYRGEDVDRRVDVYGASVVLWETLTGRELFKGDSDAAVVGAVMNDVVKPPSTYAEGVSAELDAIVMQGLSRERSLRFGSAREMALMLERSMGLATQSEVSDWLESLAGELLRQRAEMLQRMQATAELDAARGGAGGSSVTRRLDARSSTPQSLEGAGQAGLGDFTDGVAFDGATRVDVRASTVRPIATGRRGMWRVLVALLFVLSLGAWLLWRFTAAPLAARASQAAPSAGRVREAPTAPQADAPPVEPVDSTTAPVDSTTAPVGTTTAPVDTTTAPRVRVKRERGREGEASGSAREGRKTPTPTTVSTKPAVDCTQPFWLDQRGIRHVKRECLE